MLISRQTAAEKLKQLIDFFQQQRIYHTRKAIREAIIDAINTEFPIQGPREINIYVQGDLIMDRKILGDNFENISNSTIVNRSMVQNAFNKIKSEHDEETAYALKAVAEHIEESRNQEAADNFNAFTEELQKPEPKKSLLKTFWTGALTALPTIANLGAIAIKIASLFSEHGHH